MYYHAFPKHIPYRSCVSSVGVKAVFSGCSTAFDHMSVYTTKAVPFHFRLSLEVVESGQAQNISASYEL